MEQLTSIVLASIISADNDRYTEEVKQEVIKRYNDTKTDWAYILEPTGKDADMYLKLFDI